ncbi:MAG: hypothetical protein E5Y67_33010, partial [Mesorhizobium sp.]
MGVGAGIGIGDATANSTSDNTNNNGNNNSNSSSNSSNNSNTNTNTNNVNTNVNANVSASATSDGKQDDDFIDLDDVNVGLGGVMMFSRDGDISFDPGDDVSFSDVLNGAFAGAGNGHSATIINQTGDMKDNDYLGSATVQNNGYFGNKGDAKGGYAKSDEGIDAGGDGGHAGDSVALGGFGAKGGDADTGNAKAGDAKGGGVAVSVPIVVGSADAKSDGGSAYGGDAVPFAVSGDAKGGDAGALGFADAKGGDGGSGGNGGRGGDSTAVPVALALMDDAEAGSDNGASWGGNKSDDNVAVAIPIAANGDT